MRRLQVSSAFSCSAAHEFRQNAHRYAPPRCSDAGRVSPLHMFLIQPWQSNAVTSSNTHRGRVRRSIAPMPLLGCYQPTHSYASPAASWSASVAAHLLTVFCGDRIPGTAARCVCRAPPRPRHSHIQNAVAHCHRKPTATETTCELARPSQPLCRLRRRRGRAAVVVDDPPLAVLQARVHAVGGRVRGAMAIC